MKIVDDNENSVFKHDRFLMSFQVFKSYIATIRYHNGSDVRFKHLKRHQKLVVFKYRVLFVIYYIYYYRLFLYIKFSLRVLNNLLLYITNVSLAAIYSCS